MNRRRTIVVETETIDDRLVALESENARPGITRLKPWRDCAHLDKTKAKAQQTIHCLRVLVETGSETEWIGKFESEGSHGEVLAIGRRLSQRH